MQLQREIQGYSYKQINFIWIQSQMVKNLPLSTPEKTTCEHHSNWNIKQIFFTNE